MSYVSLNEDEFDDGSIRGDPSERIYNLTPDEISEKRAQDALDTSLNGSNDSQASGPDYSYPAPTGGGDWTPLAPGYDPSKAASPTTSGGRSLPSGVSQEWADDFLRRNPGDYDRMASAYQSNNTSSQGRQYDSQGPAYNQATNQLNPGYGGPRPVSRPQPQPGGYNVDPQFSDPITKYLEEFAQRRAQERENPSAGSGQQLLEQALKDIGGQFQSGGYTNAEQEVFTTQQMDPLEKLRQARKQQVMQQLSARGIAPGSGVGLQMIQDVDRQFDKMRTQQQAGLAGKFADERVNRLLQGLGLYGNLAGQENTRQNEAFQYRTVPLNLADRSFSQGMQLFNAAEGSANNAYNRMSGTYNQSGNPLALVNPLLAMMGQQQGQSDSQQRALADLIWALTQGG